MPIKPPAPVVFSTTTGCPSVFDSELPISRASVSSVPPGATPTIIVIGRDGNSCAHAAPAINKVVRQPAKKRNMTGLLGLSVGPPLDGAAGSCPSGGCPDTSQPSA